MLDREAKEQERLSARSVTNVAVAVIHYENLYLLGYRNSTQHQGNLYEFIGGKIEETETASAALIREVSEETGIDIQENGLVKLGRLRHDYGDKQVCLQVFNVTLTSDQYQQYQSLSKGLEGQALKWAVKDDLLAGHYPLPAANATILAWLQIPTQITITHSIASFNENNNSAMSINENSKDWLAYHQQHIAQAAWVYIRPKATDIGNNCSAVTNDHSADPQPLITETRPEVITDHELAHQLMSLRPDIYALIPQNNVSQFMLEHYESNNWLSDKRLNENSQVIALHLTQTELMEWYSNHTQSKVLFSAKLVPAKLIPAKLAEKISSHHKLIVSCHDATSISAANLLAASRLSMQLPPVIAIFLSPVLVTKSHPDTKAIGWEAWSELAKLADMPVIALGGLSPNMSKRVAHYGGIGVAGIRQFLNH